MGSNIQPICALQVGHWQTFHAKPSNQVESLNHWKYMKTYNMLAYNFWFAFTYTRCLSTIRSFTNEDLKIYSTRIPQLLDQNFLVADRNIRESQIEVADSWVVN